MIWTKDQGYVINTHLCGMNEEQASFYAWPPKDFDIKKFLDALAKASMADCFVNLALPRANVFFRAKYLGQEETGLRFAIPVQLFKVQRRRDVRFTIPEGYVLKATYEDPLFLEIQTTKKVVDLSASGCAIAVGMEEKEVYQNDMILNKFSFSIRGKQIECRAQIKHTRETSLPGNKPAIKVGLQFLDLKPSDSQVIAAYVFEESRKFYTRYM